MNRQRHRDRVEAVNDRLRDQADEAIIRAARCTCGPQLLSMGGEFRMYGMAGCPVHHAEAIYLQGELRGAA